MGVSHLEGAPPQSPIKDDIPLMYRRWIRMALVCFLLAPEGLVKNKQSIHGQRDEFDLQMLKISEPFI